jgi:ATP-dependent Clp protease ATP-binding subunit ClpX
MAKTHKQCSFCGKNEKEVKNIVGTDTVFICNECVTASLDLMEISRETENVNRYKQDITPSKMKEFLDDYVVGQDSAKITISLAVYNHYKRLKNESSVEISKSNILMIGPTGSGHGRT